MTEPTQGETLRERVADALWRAEGLATDWKITGSWADLDVEDQDYWLFQADAVIPLVTEDVQRRIAEALRQEIGFFDCPARVLVAIARWIETLDLSDSAEASR